MKPVSCNTYIKAMNAFCRWLHEGGHHQERLELPTLLHEELVIQTLNDDDIRRLLTVKPTRFDQWRLHALVALLLDTGICIEGGLCLRLSGVAFDNLLVTVYGKGRKERRIPFSLELHLLQEKLRLSTFGWHRLRHTFATEDLSANHQKVSILNRRVA